MDKEALRKLLGERLFSNNEDRLKEVSALVKKGEVVPVVGAGLSCDYGLPAWGKMTRLMFLQRFDIFGSSASLWKHGKTPLYDAVESFDTEILSTLIEHGAVFPTEKYIKDPVIRTVQIGDAHVVCARTRAKYIGGSRAVYEEE